MADGMFYINISLADVANMGEEAKREAEAVLGREAQNLALMTYGHIVEQVQEKLHSSREKYLSHLKVPYEEGSGTWVVELEPEAMWIEEGMPRHEMIDDILFGKKGGQPYTAKDGSRYKIVPFPLNKPPTASTVTTRELQRTIKDELKKRGISYGKKEVGPDGRPLVGTLHRLDIMDKPIKTMDGVGQGHGPIGEVRQGTTGTPFLQNINIIQKQMTSPGGRLYTSRDIMTWRVVSSKHKGTGKWIHPGMEAKKFFDEANTWARDQWEREIKPQVLAELGLT